jgi:hypothetical protein
MKLSEVAEQQAELAKQTMAMANHLTMGFTAPLAPITEYFTGLYVETVKRFEQNVSTLNGQQSAE